MDLEKAFLVESADGTKLQAYLVPARDAAAQSPLAVLLHGANYSARSFILLTARLVALGMSVLTYDARGHGRSGDGPATRLGAEVLSSDCLAVTQAALDMLPMKPGSGLLPLAIIGHSMGGAIATHIAAAWPRAADASGFADPASDLEPPTAVARVARRCQLSCLVIIEMVESLALAALPHMQELLPRLQHQFASADAAIEWALASRTLRLRASAQLSVPYQLVPIRCGSSADTSAARSTEEPARRAASPASSTAAATAAGEAGSDVDASSAGGAGSLVGTAVPEAAAEDSPGSAADTPDSLTVEWRAWPFMHASAHCWHGWFEGATARLLDAPCPKLLLLADADSLDGPLTVAQMQGRLQVRIIAGGGHVLHEDAPDKVGEAVAGFLSRHGVTREAEAALLAAKLARAREQAHRSAAAAAVGAAAAAAGAARSSASAGAAAAVSACGSPAPAAPAAMAGSSSDGAPAVATAPSAAEASGAP